MLLRNLRNLSRSKYSGILLFTLVFFCQIATNILFKEAALSLDGYHLLSVITNKFYIASVVMLVLRLFFWQMILSTFELSLAYSLRSLGYVLLLLVSYFYFNESIGVFNIVGSLIIVGGVLIIANDTTKTNEL